MRKAHSNTHELRKELSPHVHVYVHRKPTTVKQHIPCMYMCPWNTQTILVTVGLATMWCVVWLICTSDTHSLLPLCKNGVDIARLHVILHLELREKDNTLYTYVCTVYFKVKDCVE